MDPHCSSPVAEESKKEPLKRTLLLSFQSLGVVYGRLSIAPLYVFETVGGENIKSEKYLFGFLSFMFWTMTSISLIKYIFIVLRADDNGEGGVFALYSLLCRHAKVGLLPNHQLADDVLLTREMENFSKIKVGTKARRAIEQHRSTHYLLLLLALLGSSMVIADGVLTPAISVFSASHGLEHSLSKISDQLSSSVKLRNSLSADLPKYVPVPSSCAILILLFTLQHYGTSRIGFIFAPIISLWILFIGALGAHNIFRWNRHVFLALSPGYMYRFCRDGDIKSWKSLGGVLLCIAGTESIFADLGHFSKKSIKIAFCFLVYPSLVLSYMGHTAFMSQHQDHGDYIPYLGASVPGFARHIFTALSLLATVVGCQAAITGIFSVINQCLALGCFPRVKIIHTSDKIHGQVYSPDINWILLFLCLSITIGFRDIRQMGNAAGLAIITGMLTTTCLMSLIIALYWEKNMLISAFFLIFFGAIEAMYFSACVLNFHKGAWFLIFLVAVLMMTMLVWHYGTIKKYEFDFHNRVSIDWLTDLCPNLEVARVPGIGFVYTDVIRDIPAFFSHFVTNLPAFHQVLIFVSFKPLPVPSVPPSKQYLIGRFGPKEYRVYRCIVRHGYSDSILDKDNFEDQLIRRIGEFVSVEDADLESLASPQGRMIVIGNLDEGNNAFIPQADSEVIASSGMVATGGILKTNQGSRTPSGPSLPKKKKVRFLLPPASPRIRPSVLEELKDIVIARDYGTAYFLGKTHFIVRKDSHFFKKITLGAYIFLDQNCREPSVALNIPLCALVEVGMVYNI